jgi:hypothetical protein
MTQWQPIETLPTGESVLAYDEDGGIFCVYKREDSGLLYADDPRGGGAYMVGVKLTHWMPIPPPPKEETR